MRIFGQDWTPSRIDATTFELKCGKEKVTVRKSPANDGSWFPINKGSWLALTFHVEHDTVMLGRSKQ